MGGKPAARTKKKPPQAKPASTRSAKSAKAAGRARSLVAPKRAAPSRPRAAQGEFALDKLHQVALTATNLDAAVAFYRDVLGLRFVARFDPPGLAFFNLGGGLRLLLSATASQATLYFLVDHLDAAIRELKKRGVQFLHPPSMIHRDEAGQFGKKGVEEWMAFFKDPSGNLIGLVEKR
jgi:catechol 2,3-dioxygenase-like lactoylglutathione lyase family enzyme